MRYLEFFAMQTLAGIVMGIFGAGLSVFLFFALYYFFV